MPGLDGTGPRGMGQMTGGGRGFCSPRGIGVARTVYTHRAPYAHPYRAYGFQSFAPRMTRQREMELLKTEAQVLKDELKELETEIGKLSAEKE